MAKRNTDRPSQLIKPSSISPRMLNDENTTVNINCHSQQSIVNNNNSSQQPQQSFIPRRQSSELSSQHLTYQACTANLAKSIRSISSSNNSPSQSTPLKNYTNNELIQQQYLKQAFCPISKKNSSYYKTDKPTPLTTDQQTTQYHNVASPKKHYDCYPVHEIEKLASDVILKPPKDSFSSGTTVNKSNQNNEPSDSEFKSHSNNKRRRHYDASYQKMMNERRLTYTVTENDLPKKFFSAIKKQSLDQNKTPDSKQPDIHSEVPNMNIIGLPLRYNHYGDSWSNDNESPSKLSESKLQNSTSQKQNIPTRSSQRRMLGDYVQRVNGYISQNDPLSSLSTNDILQTDSTSQNSSQKNSDQQKQPISPQNRLTYRPPLDSNKIPRNEIPRYSSRMVGNESEEQDYVRRLPRPKISGFSSQRSSINESNAQQTITNLIISDNDHIDDETKRDRKHKDSHSEDENLSRQPKFEAFIMTGDSMIKLSSNETEKQQKQKLCPFTAELTPAELYLSQQQNKLIPEKSGVDLANKDELDHKLHNKILYNDDERDNSNCDAQTSHICDTKVKNINKFAVNIISDGFTTANSDEKSVDKQRTTKSQMSVTIDKSGENGQISYNREYPHFHSHSVEENNIEFPATNSSSLSISGVNRSTQTHWIPSRDNQNDETNVSKLDEVVSNNSVRSTSNVAVQCTNSYLTLDRSRKIADSIDVTDQQTTSASSPVSSASSGFYSSEIVDQNKQMTIQTGPSRYFDRNQHPTSNSSSNVVQTILSNNAPVSIERSDMSLEDQFDSSCSYAASIVESMTDATQRVKVKELFLEPDNKVTDNITKATKTSKPLFGFLGGRKLSSCDNLLVNGKIEDSQLQQHTTRVHGGHNNKNLVALSAALQHENKTITSNDIIATTTASTHRDSSNSISSRKNINTSVPSTDAQSTSIANAAKRLFFNSNKNINTNNFLPHAEDEYTYDKHYDKESHGKHKKSLKSRKDNDLQNVYPLHAAISHDDLSNGPLPGTIRLQQSHFSSTPSVAHDPRQNKQSAAVGHQYILDKTDSTVDGKEKRSNQQINTQTIRKISTEEQSSAMDNRPNSKMLHTNQEDALSQKDIDRYKLSFRLHEECHEDDSSLQINIPKNTTSPSQAADDRAAARRLAERLYKLDGFSESDVSQHLSRNNTFSLMVTEEYLQFFDFRGINLDSALRKFLSKVHLNGETQERELILSKFSQHYYGCNKNKFAHWEAVQTLVCALILLNTDLHGGHSKNRSKLSMDAFIAGLNDSTALFKSSGNDHCELKPFTFPKHMLVKLYGSIKKHPLKYSDDSNAKKFAAELDSIYSNGRANTLPTRRFVPGANAPTSTLTASARKQFKMGLRDEGLSDEMGDTSSSIDFKTGYLMRKRIFDANGKPTPRGRRSWKRVYITVKDLVIFIKIVEDAKPTNSDCGVDTSNLGAKSWSENLRNSIRIHHAYASKAISYTKREFVFHLCVADQAEYLFQAADEQEMNSWIETINFATACLSAPVLPGAVGSNQKKIQRPLFPSSYTKLSFWEQLLDHDERLQKLKIELDEHLAKAPVTKKATKKDRSDFIEKIALLRHEIERYSTYVDCMRKKSNSPEAVLLSKHSKSLSSSFKPIAQ